MGTGRKCRRVDLLITRVSVKLDDGTEVLLVNTSTTDDTSVIVTGPGRGCVSFTIAKWEWREVQEAINLMAEHVGG
jgi:16S rRNA G1207 methylase RsmC